MVHFAQGILIVFALHTPLYEYMNTLRNYLKKNPTLKLWAVGWRQVTHASSWSRTLSLFLHYVHDWRRFSALPSNTAMPASTDYLQPALFDNTSTTELEPTYFYQDAWCAKKIAENRPNLHVDVGSHVGMLSIVAQFVPVTMVDIRPLSLPLSGLTFVEGSITSLPFKDGEVDSLSSICVIEHIGLGRYGDKLDQFGTEKAAGELVRVLAPLGNLYISVPVDTENRLYFNAHRAFTRQYIIELFSGLTLVEEKYIYGNDFCDTYEPKRGFGTGL